jgi:hypothetical protein
MSDQVDLIHKDITEQILFAFFKKESAFFRARPRPKSKKSPRPFSSYL